jgi:hypothetical protein
MDIKTSKNIIKQKDITRSIHIFKVVKLKQNIA